ncbi:MAG: type II toxin-antitoxin system RelE/ParE family toxin [Candidatus Anammoxibacter sp.]
MKKLKMTLDNFTDTEYLIFGLKVADRYYDRLFEHFDKIAENPQLFTAVDHIRIAYRRSVYRSHAIYFRIEGETAQIMRILGQQDPKKQLI